MFSVRAFVKNHKLPSIVIAIVLVGGGYYWYQSTHSSAGQIRYLTQAATKTTITVAITGTGQVSALNRIDIKPQGSNTSASTLTAVNVKQGDKVKAGQVIAVIDQRNSLLSLNQAKASLGSAQANYDKLLAGATPQDIAVSKASVASAQLSLDNAKISYDNTVKQQQLAVNNALTSLLNVSPAAIPSSTNTSTATISFSGSYMGTDQGQYTIRIDNNNSGYSYVVLGLENYVNNITRGIPEPLGTRGLYITFSTTGTLTTGDTWTIPIPNTLASGYLGAYNSYQSALQSQNQALTQAQASINNAQASLVQAQANLTLKEAPPTPQDIETAKVQVETAQAQVENAQINYDANFIKATFDGVVAQLNNQAGDQVNSSTIIATIITTQKLATISLNEIDVSKIQLDQQVTLTFPAIDGLSITGKVAEIDNIGTVSQGVVTYNVKIGFDTQDDRVKSGMSVSADVITNVKTDVIAVPNAAVKSNNQGNYVQMLDASGQPQNKTVQIGIVNDTMTEITSGLNEGDLVVTQTINPNAKSTTTTSSGAGGIRLPGLTGGGGGRPGG